MVLVSCTRKRVILKQGRGSQESQQEGEFKRIPFKPKCSRDPPTFSPTESYGVSAQISCGVVRNGSGLGFRDIAKGVTVGDTTCVASYFFSVGEKHKNHFLGSWLEIGQKGNRKVSLDCFALDNKQSSCCVLGGMGLFVGREMVPWQLALSKQRSKSMEETRDFLKPFLRMCPFRRGGEFG